MWCSMRAFIQRVRSASVTVDDSCVATIGYGFVVLLGIKAGDTTEDSRYVINKLLKLRIFPDDQNNMNNSIIDVKGELLIISQFTLYGDMRKGNRPSFSNAMVPQRASIMYDNFVAQCKQHYPKVKTGIFGSYMQVALVNDGPVTLLLDSSKVF